MCLGLGHGVQGAGKCLLVKVPDVMQCRLLERPQRLIHSAAGNTVARGQQELAKGRSPVHVVELGHAVLDHGAQVLNVIACHNLLVDCNVDLFGSLPPPSLPPSLPPFLPGAPRPRCSPLEAPAVRPRAPLHSTNLHSTLLPLTVSQRRSRRAAQPRHWN